MIVIKLLAAHGFLVMQGPIHQQINALASVRLCGRHGCRLPQLTKEMLLLFASLFLIIGLSLLIIAFRSTSRATDIFTDTGDRLRLRTSACELFFAAIVATPLF